RCHVSGATYGPPGISVTELMVVLGKAKAVRLVQLVGVPAVAGSSAMQLMSMTDAMGSEGSTIDMREHMVRLHCRARARGQRGPSAVVTRLLANEHETRGELRAGGSPRFPLNSGENEKVPCAICGGAVTLP